MTASEFIRLLENEDQSAYAYFGSSISGGGVCVSELIHIIQQDYNKNPNIEFIEKPSRQDGTIHCSNKKYYEYECWYIVLPSDMVD